MNISSGDTAFILICCALVFLMTPALAFFYGGLARRKNVLNTMFSSFFVCGILALLWIVIGYSLAFGGNIGGIIGSLKDVFLNGVGTLPNPTYAKTIPELLFAAFQMMFALITFAIVTGATEGRMKFGSLVVLAIAWSFVVYYPLAHMMWGQGGFLAKLGAVDFAGGNVVHIASGVAGLVVAIMLGKRKNHDKSEPHNIPFVLLGAGLLWFGWFGFNAGSALGANGLAVQAFMTTAAAASTAIISWMVVEKITKGKPTLLGAATGAVVGLVGITPGAGFVPIWAAIIIGAVASPLCYFATTTFKNKLGYDDALDAFGCHGIGGIWGGIATGLFAQTSINSVAKWNGLVFGDSHLFVAQLEAIGFTIVFVGAATFAILFVIKKVMGLRVEESHEEIGLDISEHGEIAYPDTLGLEPPAQEDAAA